MCKVAGSTARCEGRRSQQHSYSASGISDPKPSSNSFWPLDFETGFARLQPSLAWISALSEIPNEWLFGSLLCLIFLSAFFSSSETGLMAINRIRLQHQAESGSAQAKRILALLDRPDRLIGLILIG
ncbi:MAG: DUF21 domain-containing protein, partial [Gammaproteobacteria bacterium]|nr:DUF21 domain-containing protein [Gammaproteobacteria bacterium]